MKWDGLKRPAGEKKETERQTRSEREGGPTPGGKGKAPPPEVKAKRYVEEKVAGAGAAAAEPEEFPDFRIEYFVGPEGSQEGKCASAHLASLNPKVPPYGHHVMTIR